MRRYSSILAVLAALGGCGEGPDEQALARCKDEVHKALGGTASVTFPRQDAPALRNDGVYGWHLDVEVDAADGTGRTRRAGYRCLFLVENRQTPLFLALVER